MEVCIMQCLPDKTKVRLDKNSPKLFPEENLTEFSKTLCINLKNASRYRNGSRALPLKLFENLVKLNKRELVEFQGKLSFKMERGGNYLKIGPYIEIDENWIYVSQLINGDGHVHRKFWYIDFTNQDLTLINYVYDFFKKCGLESSCFNINEKPDGTSLTIRPGILAPIMCKLLEISVGKKDEISIPDWIISNHEFSIAALRGAFDAEGCVSLTATRRISITSNSLKWIEQLHRILEKCRIKSRIYKEYKNREKPLHRLFITHIENLRRFREIVKPLHSKRKLKLEEACKEFDRDYDGKYHKAILSAISEGINRKRDIQNYLKISSVKVLNNLYWFKRHKLIYAKEKVITNLGGFHTYDLTENGKKFLQESGSFFD
ncbi:MAG: hypothetical protein KKE50_02590 [Nanoarchaeota archaeon]|nr:hypothetical protein [Nanoarchaeota archaeon]